MAKRKTAPKYTILHGNVTVKFTADMVPQNERMRLAEELTELCHTESLDTDELLSAHSLNIGSYKLLSEQFPTLAELSKATDEQLLSIRCFGKRRLYFLREALGKEGYKK